MTRGMRHASAYLAALVCAFGLGADKAEGLAGGTITAAEIQGQQSLVATDNGDVYWGTHGFDGSSPSWTLLGNIGAGSQVVGVHWNATVGGVNQFLA
jgi:hypothetical protein